jgi:hypothetical protein
VVMMLSLTTILLMNELLLLTAISTNYLTWIIDLIVIEVVFMTMLTRRGMPTPCFSLILIIVPKGTSSASLILYLLILALLLLCQHIRVLRIV